MRLIQFKLYFDQHFHIFIIIIIIIIIIINDSIYPAVSKASRTHNRYVMLHYTIL